MYNNLFFIITYSNNELIIADKINARDDDFITEMNECKIHQNEADQFIHELHERFKCQFIEKNYDQINERSIEIYDKYNVFVMDNKSNDVILYRGYKYPIYYKVVFHSKEELMSVFIPPADE